MRTSRGKAGGNPRTVYLEISIWEAEGLIHVAHNDPQGRDTFHVAVSPDAGKPNGHPKFYDELLKCLRSGGVQSKRQSNCRLERFLRFSGCVQPRLPA
jgi:hypothetical protein